MVSGGILALPRYLHYLPEFGGEPEEDIARRLRVGFSMVGQRLSIVRAPPMSPEGALPDGLRMARFIEVRDRIDPT